MALTLKEYIDKAKQYRRYPVHDSRTYLSLKLREEEGELLGLFAKALGKLDNDQLGDFYSNPEDYIDTDKIVEEIGDWIWVAAMALLEIPSELLQGRWALDMLWDEPKTYNGLPFDLHVQGVMLWLLSNLDMTFADCAEANLKKLETRAIQNELMERSNAGDMGVHMVWLETEKEIVIAKSILRDLANDAGVVVKEEDELSWTFHPADYIIHDEVTTLTPEQVEYLTGVQDCDRYRYIVRYPYSMSTAPLAEEDAREAVLQYLKINPWLKPSQLDITRIPASAVDTAEFLKGGEG